MDGFVTDDFKTEITDGQSYEAEVTGINIQDGLGLYAVGKTGFLGAQAVDGSAATGFELRV